MSVHVIPQNGHAAGLVEMVKGNVTLLQQNVKMVNVIIHAVAVVAVFLPRQESPLKMGNLWQWQSCK